MITILIVDDSETETLILKKIFEKESDIRVIGSAKNGKEAIQLTKLLNPNLITMDIQMPVMDGLEAIRHIMSSHPTPIVVISSKLNDEKLRATYSALDAGALSVLEKPVNVLSPNFEPMRKLILQTIRNMAQIKVIKRRFYSHTHTKNLPKKIKEKNLKQSYDIIAIGTSVGGPQVLKKILSELPENFALPIVVVQHMTQGFISGFTSWLNENTALQVKEAEHKEILKKGFVYFAPDHHHLEIDKMNHCLIAKLTDTAPVSGFRPSATVLLKSVAKICGAHAVGILLTGMGSDGAEGLLAVREAKGLSLIQDQKSAVVFGMGGVAQSLDAVDEVVELDKIAAKLQSLTNKEI